MPKCTSRLTQMSVGAIIVLATMLMLFAGSVNAYALDVDDSATEESVQVDSQIGSAQSDSLNDQEDVREPDQDANQRDTREPDQDVDQEDGQELSTSLESDQTSSDTTQSILEFSSDSEDLAEQDGVTLSLQSIDSNEGKEAQTKAVQEKAADNLAVYRLYNFSSGEHFYTLNKNERNHLASIGWFYEGLGWMAPSSGNAVYRLYNPNSGDHHYTLAESERDYLPRVGWRYEGIAFYSPDKSNTSALPIYRQFNPNETIGTHNFSPSKSENDHLVSIGWRSEGIGWYCYSTPADFKDDLAPWEPKVSGDMELDRWIYVIEKSNTTLSSCFNYVKGFRYINGTKYWSNPRILSDAVTISHAKSFFNNKGGNCYQYAAAFKWLARGLGYDAQVISGWVKSYSGGQAPHGWAEVKQDGKTYVCDPDMAHSLPGYNWYMVTYDKAPISYYNW